MGYNMKGFSGFGKGTSPLKQEIIPEGERVLTQDERVASMDTIQAGTSLLARGSEHARTQLQQEGQQSEYDLEGTKFTEGTAKTGGLVKAIQRSKRRLVRGTTKTDATILKEKKAKAAKLGAKVKKVITAKLAKATKLRDKLLAEKKNK